MPTLIRLIVILLVLVGLAYGAMFALVAAVAPREKQVTIRIPTRELVPSPERQTFTPREIDTSRKPEPTPAAEPTPAPDDSPSIQAAPASQAPSIEAAPAAPEGGGDVVTLQQGIE